MFINALASVLAFSATALALAFDGPRPTPVVESVDPNGWTPKPTNAARALPDIFRRKSDDGLCGYVEGDKAFPISCNTGSCFHNTQMNWFGCCTGSNVDSCDVFTRCIESVSVSSCLSDSACYDDPAVLGCSVASAPYCAKMYTVVSQVTVSHLVCAAKSTMVEVLASLSGSSESTAPILLMSGSVTAVDSSTLSPNGGDGSASSRGATATNAVATTSSKASAAMHTAGPVAGIAGAFVGVLALLL